MYILPVENRANKHAHYRKRMHTCEYNGPSLHCFVPPTSSPTIDNSHFTIYLMNLFFVGFMATIRKCCLCVKLSTTYVL